MIPSFSYQTIISQVGDTR